MCMYMCMCMSISVYANMHVNMPMYMCVTIYIYIYYIYILYISYIYIIYVFFQSKVRLPISSDFHIFGEQPSGTIIQKNGIKLASSAHPMAQGLRLFSWGRCLVSHAGDGRDRLVVAASWADLLAQQDIALANLLDWQLIGRNWSAKCQQNVKLIPIFIFRDGEMSIHVNSIQ
jgi:hypothetical protein